MAGPRTLLVVAVCAAAFGGLAGAVAVALRDPSMADAPGDRDTGGDVRPEPPPPDAAPPHDGGRDTPPPAGLTRRLDDPDPDVRHALALELLRRGPAALAQARALRPVTPEGADLQSRLVLALDKLRRLRGGGGYARLAEHLRMRLDLAAYASVVPETLLLDERLAYWPREIDAIDVRLERNLADPAERSLAELELAFARRQAGELDADAYVAEAERLLPDVERLLGDRRADRSVGTAEVEDLERQIERMRP